MLIYNTMVGYKELLFYIMKVISKEYAIMNAVISKKETIISYTIAILFILAMVTAGVLLNDGSHFAGNSGDGNCFMGVS